MTCHGAVVLAAVLALPLAPVPALADGLRCAGGLVSLGDSKLDLLVKCGAPSLAEQRTDDRSVVDPERGFGRRVVTPVDRWTYDHGRNRFLDIVTLVRGKVTAVERGGYGYADEPRPRERPRRSTCDPALLAEGKLMLEILARCGEPALIDAWQEELRSVQTVDGATVFGEAVTRVIELWTYDFGSSRFLRFVRFEDGKVTRVDSGGYGYGD